MPGPTWRPRTPLRRHHHIQQRRPLARSARAFDRRLQLLGALDALAMQAESARHRRMVGELQPRADDLAVRLLLVVHLDLPRLPLLATTMSTGALWRAAVSISIALKPNAPSPVATATVRSGQRQAGRDAEGRADADAAERPGSR